MRLDLERDLTLGIITGIGITTPTPAAGPAGRPYSPPVPKPLSVRPMPIAPLNPEGQIGDNWGNIPPPLFALCDLEREAAPEYDASAGWIMKGVP